MKNKYQEALNVVNQSDDEKFIKDSRAYFDKYKINPVSVLQQLVDKEVPIKPKRIKEFITFNGISYKIAKCPKCKEDNKVREYILMHRCYTCGQKIDWSDDDEDQN